MEDTSKSSSDNICVVAFSNESSATNGSDPIGYTCSVCNKTFQKKSRLETHFRSHSGERPFLCKHPFCGKSFTRSDHLSRHMRSHNDDRRHICSFPDCNQAFITLSHLKRHQLVHSKDHQTYKCCKCFAVFPKKSILRSHRLSVHGEADFRCMLDYCGKIFVSQSKLDRHTLQHKSKRYRCKYEDCSIFVASYYDLHRHYAVSHDDISDSESSDEDEDEDVIPSLQTPALEIANTTEVKHSEAELTKMQLDDGETLSPVITCSFIFNRKRSITSISEHNTVDAHGNSQAVVKCPSDDGRYHCSYENCPRSFTMFKNLKAHIKAVHDNDGRFQCNYPNCNQIFGFKAVLERHFQSIHVDGKRSRVVIPKDQIIRESVVQQLCHTSIPVETH